MITLFNHNWKFSKENVENAHLLNFDDSSYRVVSVPHDYAIEGPFSPENDKQVAEVLADGVSKTMHIGRTGGLPICDHAWYRKNFKIDENSKNVFLEFDGIMSNATIYVNGEKCHEQVYGYTSFSVDITKFVKKENTLTVVCRPEHTSSRYYTGAGIYRNVRLVEKNEVYLPYHPVFVRPAVINGKAVIDFDIDVVSKEQYDIKISILDADGKEVSAKNITSNKSKVSDVISFEDFNLWEVLDAYLYTFNVKLLKDGICMDQNTTKFGIRTIKYSANEGLFINNKYTKLKGVCMHHDLGALGARVNVSAIRRQIEKLIGIGVNAIRFTHNPPSPEYIDLCDEYGILTIDEAFDEWKLQKLENGYGKYFDDHAENDLVAMLKRDRNHPSIIMWSIGNEIVEQRVPYGWKYAKFLSEICKREDKTRPVTAGFDIPEQAFELGLCEQIDIVGLNYKPHQYTRFHEIYKDAVLYGSETASCVSSRGHYYLPRKFPYDAIAREDLQLCSYELESPPWATYPDKELFVQKNNDYLLGEFVWTGFDYLGEPTPYRQEWPSRSSYFGIFDLCGLEKDRANLYKANWSNEKVLHIFPHWNWNEGDIVDVHCYTTFEKVELFLNGKSLGILEKDHTNDIGSNRLIWKNIPFEKGEIKAVSIEDPTFTSIRKTAYAPYKIVLTSEHNEVLANDDDLAFVLCEIYDENGVLCPKANNKIEFSVEGGEYVASDAGDATSLRTFSEGYCEVFNGKCVIILKTNTKGSVKLKATSDGLQSADVEIEGV